MRGHYAPESFIDFSQEANRTKMLEALAKVESELGKNYPIVVNGERRETGKWITSINPGNLDQVVGKVAMARPSDIEDAIVAAGEAMKSWKKLSVQTRASVLFKMAAIIRRRRFEYTAWMAYELDKGWAEADGEVAEAVDFLEWYGRHALKLSNPTKLGHLDDEANEYFHQPIGVGVSITPWNFPLAILVGMTMAPVVVGNGMLLKPASNTPILAYKMYEVMEEAGVPAGIVNFVPGSGSEIGDLMTDDPRVRFITFTGSKAVGVRIYERAAKVHPGQRHLKTVVAEMGGKDAIIVDKSADIEAAVEGIVASAFGFAGQKCSACSRVIVHQDVAEAITKGVVERTKAKVSVGTGVGGASAVTAIADANQFESVKNYIEIGAGEGTLAYAGEVPAELNGYYVPPVIYSDVKRTARIACEEIFGPVLAIIPVADFDEALDVANESEYGLTGSVYARDRSVLDRSRTEFEVGNLYLNRKCTGAMVGVHPFGGFKMSGTDSKAGGPEYLYNFVEAKSVAEKL
ncbi:MAG: L-glutamate gamma-semialdehyde dehydrogenase [Thermomicrobiales bacterium]